MVSLIPSHNSANSRELTKQNAMYKCFILIITIKRNQVNVGIDDEVLNMTCINVCCFCPKLEQVNYITLHESNDDSGGMTVSFVKISQRLIHAIRL